MKKITFFILLAFFVSNVNSQTVEKQYTSYEDILIPNHALVKLKKGINGERIISQMPQNIGFTLEKLISKNLNAWLYSFNDQVIDVESVLDLLFDLDDVELAQVDTYVTFREVPNDPLYGNQWQNPKIQLPDAWDITTGGTTATGERIVVCVVESANVMGHTDLQANHWKNLAEIPNNGIDDDGNGYIDDYNGWNPVQNNDNIGTGSHGTSVAGMIGAVGNNGIGIAGANWDVDIMVVTVGNLTQSNVMLAYDYPLDQRIIWNDTNGAEGALVVATNSSWGIDFGNPNNYPLWCNHYDLKGEAGILSCAATSNSNVNIDVVGDMPTTCPSEYMVSVTATNANDIKDFAAYGLVHVDVAAPGSNIYTTTTTAYGYTSGTSFASPFTAGVIGLMYSIPCESFMDIVKSDPKGAAEMVRDALFDGVDQSAHLQALIKYGGRINAKNTIDLLMDAVCVLHNTDVGVKNLIDPVDGELTASETITVTVRNYGVNPQSNFSVYYNIDGGANVTETFTGTLNSMEEAQFSFSATADLSTAGHTYTIVSGTDLTGDQNVNNDEISVEVTNTGTVGIEDNVLENAELIVLTLENNQFEVILTTLESLGDNVYINVYNALGQSVRYEKLESNEEGNYNYMLDMRSAATGVYFVKVGTLNKANTQRIIVK